MLLGAASLRAYTEVNTDHEDVRVPLLHLGSADKGLRCIGSTMHGENAESPTEP